MQTVLYTEAHGDVVTSSYRMY